MNHVSDERAEFLALCFTAFRANVHHFRRLVDVRLLHVVGHSLLVRKRLLALLAREAVPVRVREVLAHFGVAREVQLARGALHRQASVGTWNRVHVKAW